MPTEFDFELYAEREVLLPAFTGYVSRGLLLNIVGQVNPSLAQELHEANRPKPYSVTPIYFKSRKRSFEGYLLDPAYAARVKFRFLRDDYARSITDYFLKKNTVMIFDTTFRIASIAVKCKEYEEICEETVPSSSLRLDFRTPTYFASMGSSYHHLFPDPVKIFPYLLRLWNVYATAKKCTKDEFLEYKSWMVGGIGVSRYRLESRFVFMGKKKVSGFIGSTTYEMKPKGEWGKLTCILARFAEYSNIGGNRTGGFGVVKVGLPTAEAEKKREVGNMRSHNG